MVPLCVIYAVHDRGAGGAWQRLQYKYMAALALGRAQAQMQHTETALSFQEMCGILHFL